MRSLLALAAASAIMAHGDPAAAQVGQFPFALTREGQMLGSVEGDVASFKGLAYAAAPSGRLRWRPPQPAPEGSEMRTAYDYGPACPQPSVRPVSEDCLTLNVFRPFGVDGPLPVMVFVHGGGFVAGTANDPLFDGAKLAQAGVIVVAPNYRLGAFGFLVHPALADGGSDGSNGNYGLMDLVAALRWVRGNIAAFGGDPNNVTLFGTGAGATSIALLMLSAQSRALFHKAILESIPGRARLPSPEAALAAGKEFLDIIGRGGQDFDPRATDAKLVLAAERLLLAKSPRSFGPVADGRLVKDDVAAGFSAGRESRIPLIIGSNGDEASFLSESDARQELDLAGLDALRKLYPELLDRPAALAARLYADRVFTEPARHLARSHAATGAPTFRYRFAYVPVSQRASDDGGRGRELQFIFGVEGVPGAGVFTRADREVANLLRTYWINFARSGDPNAPGLPRWDASAGDERLLLIDNERVTSGPDPWSERLDRLARRYPKG